MNQWFQVKRYPFVSKIGSVTVHPIQRNRSSIGRIYKIQMSREKPKRPFLFEVCCPVTINFFCKNATAVTQLIPINVSNKHFFFNLKYMKKPGWNVLHLLYQILYVSLSDRKKTSLHIPVVQSTLFCHLWKSQDVLVSQTQTPSLSK